MMDRFGFGYQELATLVQPEPLCALRGLRHLEWPHHGIEDAFGIRAEPWQQCSQASLQAHQIGGHADNAFWLKWAELLFVHCIVATNMLYTPASCSAS